MKDTILRAAEQEIRLKGLSFTMDDLVSRLGISKKTIYQHISSKEEIIKELLLEMKRDIDKQQTSLFNEQDISIADKMKGLIKILPSKSFLITPITLNQLKKSFPKLYSMVNEIYHCDWDRFNALYEQGVKQGVIMPFDVEFFKELYIISVTNLLDIPSMSKYTYKDIVEKTVDALFDGIEC